jgi:hypothetical protein
MMDLSLVLAKFWGFFLMALCGSFLVKKRGYADFIEKFEAEETVFLYSLVATIVGAFSVAMLNSWTVDYRGIITLLGWSALLKGFSGLLLPGFSIGFINRFSRHWSFIFCLSALLFLLGIWLLLIGFIG